MNEQNVNTKEDAGVRKRVWNFKVHTLEKMKEMREYHNCSMPEVIDLAVALLYDSDLDPMNEKH
jgi:hypothetical protein